MTIEELRKVRALKLNAEIIAEELNALYFPYVSPFAPKGEGSNPNRGSDPTPRAVERIDRKRKELEEVMNAYTEKVCEIEEWLKTIEDLELSGIIRTHYILGKSWKNTAKIVYGYASREAPRKRIERFFKSTQCTT
jgi:hypothetical protein